MSVNSSSSTLVFHKAGFHVSPGAERNLTGSS